MKRDLLTEIWRVRDELGTQCGHDPKRLAALVRREEVKAGKRLVRAPQPPPRRRPLAPA